MMQKQDEVRINRLTPMAMFALLPLLFLAAMCQADTDRSHGLLWEVGKPGQISTYLFGTIHSEDPSVVKLPATVRRAFDDADSVVLEMLMDTEAMMYSGTAMLMLDGRSLPDVIGMPLYNRVSAAIESRGIPALLLKRMKPWAVAVSLSLPLPETGQVLDLVLYRDALLQDKPVYGLETIQEQLDVFDTLSEADQVTLLKEAVENLPEQDDMYAELLALYRQRDLGGIMAINDVSMQAGNERLAKEFQRRLVDDRNHRMVTRMQPYLQQGGAFVAVGALHLPGEEGLLNLLEQQGYSVSRVY